jgi:branched-chain amino acid transport system ATP-binding protein
MSAGIPPRSARASGEASRAAPGSSAATAVLHVHRLARAFGGLHAVDDVSFSVGAAELVALIGPNGAGKTTCFNLVNGQLRPDAGEVRLLGTRIDGRPADAIAHLGVGRTFQVAATFASMTVRENVDLALAAHASREHRFAWPAATDAALRLLQRVGCAELVDAHAATLAYGDAKRVELALALAGRPRLLLMDEPTAGMSPQSRAALMRVTADIARTDGIAVLFTEHDMDMVFGFADRVIVLDRGRIIAQGTPDAIRANPQVQAVYLGVPAA